ncbi:MAG: alpha-L-rhamnosidase, partial [Prevotella sp.]|nr:alpha-L-rhamnosidase [Prevotella sp.]
RIRPQLASLSRARAIIPTIKGEISMDIENKSGEYRMQLRIPTNMESEVYLPLLSDRYEVKINGAALKTTRLKDAPFICIGDLPPGTYTIVMRYK